MDPKPSRLPRRITVQPSPSSPISSRMLRTGRLGGRSDTYRTRESSLRHDSDYQDSSPLRSSSRDWTFRERETIEPSWKSPSSSSSSSSSYQHCSGSYVRPVSGSFLGNRSRVSAASSQPSWYEPLDRPQNTFTGLSSQQDWDSKRPKLSYGGYTSLSSGRSTSSSYSTTPDLSRGYVRFPRTSPSIPSEVSRDRERERRVDTSIHEPTEYGHRNSDITPSYLQDRVSSYAQGARPKDTSISTVRLNTSISRQLPSQTSSFTRDSSRNSRTATSRDLRSPQRESSSEVQRTTSRSEGTSRTTSGQISPTPRQTSVPTTPSDGRRTTRHLLSRLASSMSSTFFSRRSSPDSLSGRSQDTEAQQSLPHAAPEPSAATSTNTETPENRPSEQSQGFAFLRRRRWGLSSMSAVSPSQSSDSDADSYRSEDSETRTSGSWLPHSLRNRYTPLFSRRRREGRDETARASSTSDTSRVHNPFRRLSQEDSSLDEVQTNNPGAAASGSSSPRSSDTRGSSAAAAIAETLFSRRGSGISGMIPRSLLHLSVPAELGNALSDNVMITVDIVPSGRTSDGQESEKAQSSSRDPEKLKKIKESLLLEDSEEEEGDLCRICQTGASSPTNPLIEPCRCSGSLQYVHQDCMKKWLQAKINSGSSLETITTCELCKEKLSLDLEDFDIEELYQAHANERADYEFISSGLYLVVLLHLCEQRFSDMLGAANETNTRFINLARTLQAHMEDLDTSEDDSEDEGV
ncbi:E3 ubiquitin-protein ligase MARCHF7 isoform X2 [Hyperolius riggenbachi]|uniref:E3 ubiquitin-protein ligase MARCHF7 isoform X2 n=1 Tax=Hyperolius riggenbachi TaxID=752182 RepID=UPI0035A39C1F